MPEQGNGSGRPRDQQRVMAQWAKLRWLRLGGLAGLLCFSSLPAVVLAIITPESAIGRSCLLGMVNILCFVSSIVLLLMGLQCPVCGKIQWLGTLFTYFCGRCGSRLRE